MITITEKALEKIKEFSSENDPSKIIVRLKTIGGGCAGFSQELGFVESVDDLDEVFTFEEIRIIIDPISFQYMDGTSIDYIENSFSSGFKFINGNVKTTCGCGHSVGF